MAYGLEVFNSNGALQLSTENLDGITVIDTGTLASGSPGGSVSGVNLETELFFYNKPSTGLGAIQRSGTDTNATFTNEGGEVDYIIAKLGSNNTPNDSGGYGLEVYNSSAELIYSSNYTKSEGIEDIVVGRSLPGATILPTASETYSLNSTSFTSFPYQNGVVGPEPTYAQGIAHSTYQFLWPQLVYSGDPTGVYIFAAPWESTSSISGANGYRTYTTFDYTNNEIGVSRVFHDNYSIPMIGTFTFRNVLTNDSAIIILKRLG
jgi:hypothetical protein